MLEQISEALHTLNRKIDRQSHDKNQPANRAGDTDEQLNMMPFSELPNFLEFDKQLALDPALKAGLVSS